MAAAADYAYSVFVNCPFDSAYKDLFEAIVFAVHDCGYIARCALEVDDSSEVRIEKISKIVATCKFGIHDISRTELDPVNGLPRFNMPMELGLFLGAKRFGRAEQKTKVCLVLDTEKYRYQKFISDIAGQDIAAHGGEPAQAIKAVRRVATAQGRRSAAKGRSNQLALLIDTMGPLSREDDEEPRDARSSYSEVLRRASPSQDDVGVGRAQGLLLLLGVRSVTASSNR